ncbi:MAG: hypothetical protein HY349_00860 [Nitrospirae bacterium]|nr:hypothetical protein [Nitrospirota bacterium]
MHLKLKVLMLFSGLLMLSQPAVSLAVHLGGTTGHGGAYTSVPAEDIRNTLHNLGSGKSGDFNPNLPNASSSSAEVCVFCHTPHGSNTSAPAAAPLWNRTVPASSGYTLYSSPNFDAEGQVQPQGVSLACLSCHDGSIALDSLVNASGSGGFRSANLTAPGGTAGIITDATAFTDAAVSMDEGTRTDTGTNYQLMTGGAAPFPNLTTNLGDDHPISMKIPDTSCNSLAGTPDPQFSELCVNSPAQNGVNGLRLLSRNASSVPTDRRDALRSYPAPGGVTGQYIECASCHNPHAPRPLFLRLPSRYDAAMVVPSGGGTLTVTSFLSNGDATLIADKPNAGSLVCLSCHQK